MTDTIEKDLIINSYYIVDYFNKRGKQITAVKLQILLYFLEAIYLIQNKEETKLFEEEFYTEPYGPITKIIQKNFKDYQDITSKEIETNKENKKYIETLFQLLGNMTTYELVTLAHLSNSPWEKHPGEQIIPKLETKNWSSNLLKIKQ